MQQIINKGDFDDMLKLARVIIYISVNWSAQERISRNVLNTVMTELRINEFPIFKIDCSEQTNKYVEDWLVSQSPQNLYSNGYGEIIFVAYGKIIDYIKYPGELGIEKTKTKIEHWLNAS